MRKTVRLNTNVRECEESRAHLPQQDRPPPSPPCPRLLPSRRGRTVSRAGGAPCPPPLKRSPPPRPRRAASPPPAAPSKPARNNSRGGEEAGQDPNKTGDIWAAAAVFIPPQVVLNQALLPPHTCVALKRLHVVSLVSLCTTRVCVCVCVRVHPHLAAH